MYTQPYDMCLVFVQLRTNAGHPATNQRITAFQEQVFPANHLAMVLTNQTHNTQEKNKKRKDKYKKQFKQQNLTNSGLVNSHNIQAGNRLGLF